MGIITWFKIGAAAVLIALAGFFYFNYQHRGKVIEAQKIQIQELEAAEKYYKAQPEIDKHTQELKNEVKKAVESGDIDAVRFLYDQLRRHKTERKGKTPR
jgi:Tfp pilus assembly protein PilE